MIRTIFLTALLATSIVFSASAEETDVHRPFFAFQNGVRFSSAEERIRVLQELGYDGMGSANANDLEERLPLYDAAGLSLFSLYLGGRLEPNGTPVSATIQNAITQLNGRETMIELYVQGGSANTDEEAVAYVREVADLANASGLKIVLYPHTGFYIAKLSDAVRIARLSERDNVGVMFNLCHFLRVEPESDLLRELEAAKPYLWSVSTSGADEGGTSWSELIQTLDRGTFDQTKLFSVLDAIGYRGPVGLQGYAIKGDPTENLKRSIQAWRRIQGEK